MRNEVFVMNKTILEYDVTHSNRNNSESLSFSLLNVPINIPVHFKVIASDIAAISISMLFAGAIAIIFSHPERTIINNDIIVAQILWKYMFFLLMLILVFLYGGLYSRYFWESRELQRVVQGVTLLALCDGALIATGQAPHASVWMLTVWPIAAVLVYVFRMALRTVPFGFPAELQNVLLVGAGITPEKFLHELRESRCGPVRILQRLPLKLLADLGNDEMEHQVKIISDRFDIPPTQIRIVVAPSCEELDLAQRLFTTLSARHRPFSMMLPFCGLARRGLSLNQVIGADFVLADLDDLPTGRIGRALKRGIDLVVAILAIVLLAPLLVMIAVLLKIEGGPVFFSQLRVGKNGRRFQCLKFRTMRPDAEEQLSNLLATNSAAREEWRRHQKLAKDPRVTRLGQFLRTTSLDELPQILCVIIGDMSVVGPRPIIAPEVSGYENDRAYCEGEDFAHYASCKPGITGLWQVSGRARTTHNERVRLDRWYCNNWSIWLDVMIILKTVRAVLIRTGS
jgi:undecaprenyl-phosphate galactose phosphotransferase